MKTFKQLVNESAAKKLAKHKGKEVHFTDARSGKKVAGTYKGMKRMGGRSYAHVEHEGGATMVPPHEIHQAKD